MRLRRLYRSTIPTRHYPKYEISLCQRFCEKELLLFIYYNFP